MNEKMYVVSESYYPKAEHFDELMEMLKGHQK